jgi:hypothetical protein
MNKNKPLLTNLMRQNIKKDNIKCPNTDRDTLLPCSAKNSSLENNKKLNKSRKQCKKVLIPNGLKGGK